ncbi:MAG: hypothetical protein A3F18_02895 [Legionellales bacterium RIFCSPHIGHO2_12_FULL_37_14]|nr:MAG: hypothetical protein A3F18_02895 [Legionellales bacterium RIFCSPHIGHO2_12_FULL_37_14]
MNIKEIEDAIKKKLVVIQDLNHQLTFLKEMLTHNQTGLAKATSPGEVDDWRTGCAVCMQRIPEIEREINQANRELTQLQSKLEAKKFNAESQVNNNSEQQSSQENKQPDAPTHK